MLTTMRGFSTCMTAAGHIPCSRLRRRTRSQFCWRWGSGMPARENKQCQKLRSAVSGNQNKFILKITLNLTRKI